MEYVIAVIGRLMRHGFMSVTADSYDLQFGCTHESFLSEEKRSDGLRVFELL
jgi:hypothetical protein